MKQINILSFSFLLLCASGIIAVSCNKEEAPSSRVVTPVFPPEKNPSFVEEFDTVGNLSAKGWIFKNNSYPVGTTGWRQGRYEAAATKFPVPFIGFPAYSANQTPNDFVSCDGSCVNDIGDISAWLISPQMKIKTGDVISFYARSMDDASFVFYAKDRMQVRANYTDGSADVGGSATSVGKFTTLLLDINPNYLTNDPAGNTPPAPGFPEAWTKYTITISGRNKAPVANARFAFRYLGTDAGASSNATNTSSVVGVDQLTFSSQ